MNTLKSRIMAAADHIRSGLTRVPHIAVLTGTGLGECTAAARIHTRYHYRDIPHFPVSTVEGHPGQLSVGELGGRDVAIFGGRFHLYEGYSPQEVTFPVRVMQVMGIRKLIITNAAGGLDARFSPGDIMVIRDHINLTGRNPLAGPHDPEWGDRFPDMSAAYDPDLTQQACAMGRQCGLPVQTGVYAGLPGPSLETPAEVRFLQSIGASAVGFSTVMEVIAAVQAGIRVIGLSILTNVHHPEKPAPSSLEEILSVARKTSSEMQGLIETLVRLF